MELEFTCPHCQKTTLISDQYANQTGPCAACGKEVTVTADSMRPIAKAGANSTLLALLLAFGLGFIILLCLVVGGGLLFYRQQRAMLEAEVQARQAEMQTRAAEIEYLEAQRAYTAESRTVASDSPTDQASTSETTEP